jgi:hypothetical protein
LESAGIHDGLMDLVTLDFSQRLTRLITLRSTVEVGRALPHCYSLHANVGSDRPDIEAIGQANFQTKSELVMGDRSPKSVHKKAAQKELKSNATAQKKQQAKAAKQVAGKK